MGATAADQALSTAELLEDILLHLPLRNVLPLQRVCKGWKNVVEGSVKLQRMLCFLPIVPEENPKRGFILNPMTASVYRKIMPHISKSTFGMFSARFPLEATRDNDPIFAKNASWKRMYLTQPPFRELALHSKPPVHSHDSDAVFRRSSHPAGTTLGDFFHHCESMLKVCDKVDFNSALGWFQWYNSYAQLKQLEK